MNRSARLAELLERYAPATSRESMDRAAMRSLLAGTGDPFSRRHYDPGHFTAGGFVVDPAGGLLLLVRHRKLGKWLQPGGHVDPGDRDVIGAARREITEETGVGSLRLMGDGIFDIDAHAIPPHGEEPAHTHFDVRFLFSSDPGSLEPSAEVVDARWVPLDAVASLTADESVRRVVAKLAAGDHLA